MLRVSVISFKSDNQLKSEFILPTGYSIVDVPYDSFVW